MTKHESDRFRQQLAAGNDPRRGSEILAERRAAQERADGEAVEAHAQTGTTRCWSLLCRKREEP